MDQNQNIFKEEPLHPELLHCLEEDEIGLSLKHPLVFIILYHPCMAKMANDGLTYKKEAIQRALNNKDYRRYIFLHERPFRLHALVAILWKVEKKTLGELVAGVWTDSEFPNVNVETWSMLFDQARGYLMNEEELEVYNNLPEKITIYRGVSDNKKDTGISWTLSEEKAKWFAKRFNKDGGKVLTKRVNKSDIICYLNRRNEDEIIYLK